MENYHPSTYDNSYLSCSRYVTNAINCGNGSAETSSCSSSAIIDTSNISNSNYNGPICCTGTGSCRSAGLLRSQIDYNNTHVSNNIENNQVAIRCDAMNSCNNISLIETTNYGNVYITGSTSSASGNIKFVGNFNPNNYINRQNDFYISGDSGCTDCQISNFENVFITGSEGCKNCDISNVSNIYAYGEQSLAWYSRISNVYNGGIYCGASSSCYQIDDISNLYNSSIIGHGYQALYSIGISNVFNGSVIGIGTQVLTQSYLTNVDNVKFRIFRLLNLVFFGLNCKQQSNLIILILFLVGIHLCYIVTLPLILKKLYRWFVLVMKVAVM